MQVKKDGGFGVCKCGLNLFLFCTCLLPKGFEGYFGTIVLSAVTACRSNKFGMNLLVDSVPLWFCLNCGTYGLVLGQLSNGVGLEVVLWGFFIDFGLFLWDLYGCFNLALIECLLDQGMEPFVFVTPPNDGVSLIGSNDGSLGTNNVAVSNDRVVGQG